MKTHETHAMRYWKKSSSHQSASYRSLLESFASYNDFWSLPPLAPALSYNCKTYLWLVWYKTLLTTFALSFHLSKIVWNCNNNKGKMNYNCLFIRVTRKSSHHSLLLSAGITGNRVRTFLPQRFFLLVFCSVLRFTPYGSIILTIYYIYK